jgi:hypothetical protein
VVAALAVSATAGPAVPDPARGAALPAFGFNDDTHVQVAQAEAIRAAGGNSARIGVRWQPSEAELNALDLALTQMAARGIKPLIVYGGSTEGRPHLGREFDAVMRAFAARFGDRALGIQFGNEPNIHHPVEPRRYALALRRAARAIHSVDRGENVVAAPVSPGWPGHQRYQRRVLRAIPRAADIDVAMNVYPTGPRPIAQAKKLVRRIKRQGEGRALWITEAAIPRYLHGLRQPLLTGKLYRTLDRLGARAIYIHRLQSLAEPYEWEQLWSSGALDPAGDQTPIYQELAGARRAAIRRFSAG